LPCVTTLLNYLANRYPPLASPSQPPIWNKIEYAKVKASLTELCPKGTDEGVLSHVSALAHSMLDLKILDLAQWKESLDSHLALVVADKGKSFPALFSTSLYTVTL